MSSERFNGRRVCKWLDPTCPCQDGDACHYEGDGAMRIIMAGPWAGQPSDPSHLVSMVIAAELVVWMDPVKLGPGPGGWERFAEGEMHYEMNGEPIDRETFIYCALAQGMPVGLLGLRRLWVD